MGSLLICIQVSAQARSGMENYHQVGEEQSYLWIPMVHYTAASGFYAEMRYNYEDAATLSVFAGKSFTINKNRFSGNLVPMLGYSTGNFKGLSIALNSEFILGTFFFSSQMQYSHALNADSRSFYFNWSETGFSLSDRIDAGLAVQYTLDSKGGDFEPGIVAGFNAGAFSFPVYLFRPFDKKQFIIAGLNYEFQLRSKKRSKGLAL